jgi:integrase
MGTVFKPFVTRPLPEGATIRGRGKKRVAVWVDAAGRKRQAPVTAGSPPRLRERAGTYSAQYRDGDGIVRRVPTGCRSADAARAVLADLERRAEHVKAGIVTQAEANVAEHADTPVVEHVAAYVDALARKRGKGARRTVSSAHVTGVDRTLRRAVAECGFRRLRDLHRDAVERWVHRLLEPPAGTGTTPRRPAARTVNAKLATLTAWGNWLVESGRLTGNPFARLRKLDEADDVRRQRRALTADELDRLVTVARLRPVAQFGRPTLRIVDDTRPAKSRATWKRAELTFDTIVAAAERGRARMRPEAAARFDRAGRERALVYRVLATTGLRRGELAALAVGDVLLDDGGPAIVLRGTDAKNGKRATLPLRGDVAAELRAWLAEKAEAAGGTLPADAPLFDVPDKLVRILDRDLAAAGIRKRDDRGRTVDVHALRGTFASHLARAGVTPVTLKTLMRHARIETTLTHYADPALLDVADAVERLPSMAGTAADAVALAGGSVALTVALTSGRTRQNGALAGNPAAGRRGRSPSVTPGKTAAFPGVSAVGDIGLEPMTPSLSSGGANVLSLADTRLTASPADRCTTRCTESAERLDVLARAVALVASLPLPEADRAGVLDRVVASLAAPAPAGPALPEVFVVGSAGTPPGVGRSRRVTANGKPQARRKRQNAAPARGVSAPAPT